MRQRLLSGTETAPPEDLVRAFDSANVRALEAFLPPGPVRSMQMFVQKVCAKVYCMMRQCRPWVINCESIVHPVIHFNYPSLSPVYIPLSSSESPCIGINPQPVTLLPLCCTDDCPASH